MVYMGSRLPRFHVYKFDYKFNSQCLLSQVFKVVERTLGLSMVASSREEAIETNGLQDIGFVWVAAYLIGSS